MSSDDDSADASGDSGQAGGQPADKPRGLPSRRVRWPLYAVVVVAAVAAIVLLMVLRTTDSDEPSIQPQDASNARLDTPEEESLDTDHDDSDKEPDPDVTVYDAPLPDAQVAWSEIATEVPMHPARRYSDEQLGLYEFIDEIVFYRTYYAQYRTVDDFHAGRDAEIHRIQREAYGHERERLQFERDIEGAIRTGYRFLPADIGPDGILEQAFDLWMAKCAAEAGYPDVVLEDESEEELLQYEREFGLSANDYYDLRHSCARRAASYPTLSRDVRDELLHRIRQHLLRAVHDYIREHGIVEIPVEHHEGDVHPLEESYVRRCLEWEIAERESCAEYYRVELTEEQKAAPVPERVPVDESGPYPLVGQPCGFSEAPSLVIIDREGNYCDMFENLEFIINYPETVESQGHVSNFFFGGPRLLICPDDWVIDGEDKCRYPHPEEAALRDAFVEAHPEEAGVYGMGLHSSRYRDRD